MRTLGFAAIGTAVVALLAFLVIGLLAPSRVTIQHRRFIAAEPPEVFAVIADHERWPELWDDLTRVEVIERGPEGEVGTRRRVYRRDGTTWTELVSAYDPPYDLHFSGVDTPGVVDWQMQLTLQPGARGGTVATIRISYEPEGFVSRVVNELGFEQTLRHNAMHFLDAVARALGVETVTVDEYAIRMAQRRAKEAARREAGAEAAAKGETAAAAGEDVEGTAAADTARAGTATRGGAGAQAEAEEPAATAPAPGEAAPEAAAAGDATGTKPSGDEAAGPSPAHPGEAAPPPPAQGSGDAAPPPTSDAPPAP